jgi:hypothetical protein
MQSEALTMGVTNGVLEVGGDDFYHDHQKGRTSNGNCSIESQ